MAGQESTIQTASGLGPPENTVQAEVKKDKLSRQPKRGYSKFKNGKFNATPKGEFIKKTKENAKQSPLLQLPPELRNNIWKYALSGGIIHGEPWLQNLYAPTSLRFGLLATCRQIYEETATLPFGLNMVWIHQPWVGWTTFGRKISLKGTYRFRAWHLYTLTSLRFTMISTRVLILIENEDYEFLSPTKTPNLRRIEVCVHNGSFHSDKRLRTVGLMAMEQLESWAAKRNPVIELTFLGFEDKHSFSECYYNGSDDWVLWTRSSVGEERE